MLLAAWCFCSVVVRLFYLLFFRCHSHRLLRETQPIVANLSLRSRRTPRIRRNSEIAVFVWRHTCSLLPLPIHSLCMPLLPCHLRDFYFIAFLLCVSLLFADTVALLEKTVYLLPRSIRIHHNIGTHNQCNTILHCCMEIFPRFSFPFSIPRAYFGRAVRISSHLNMTRKSV